MRRGVKNNRISVIIPVYNVEKFLSRCVNSVINQTFTDFEIILVDDGSTDRSAAICDSFAAQDNRVIVVHKKNGGLSDARNVGIKESSGEYLFFLDSDDWLEINALDILWSTIERYNADIVECNIKNVFKNYCQVDSNCDGSIKLCNNVIAIKEGFSWGSFKTIVCNKLYKRSIFNNILFPVSKLHEDEFISYRLFYNAKRCASLNVSLYNYDRTREHSITSRFKLSNLDVCDAFLEKMIFINNHDDLLELSDQACSMYLYVLCMSLARCYKNNLSGPRIDKVIDDAKNYSGTILSHDIDPFCKKCFIILLDNGYSACAKYWLRNGKEL